MEYVGIVIIFLDFNFKVFLLYGWFLIICLDVMKLIKWFSWLVEYFFLVDFLDVIGFLILICWMCFLVVLNLYFVNLGISYNIMYYLFNIL